MKKLGRIVAIMLCVLLIASCSKAYDRIVTKPAPELKKMFENGETFVMYAGTETCETCKKFKPIVAELCDNYKDLVIYYFPADNYESEEVKDIIFNYLYKLEYTPTIYYVENGKAVDIVETMMEYEEMESWLQGHDILPK